MIEAKNLKKHYRSKVAVDNLTFTIESGKVTGFLGPNGAGKSTTMRLMLGLDVGSGTTMYDGRFLSEYDTPSNIVGILLEAKAFHPTRKPRDHLRVLAAASGLPGSRVDEVLDIVGLTPVAKKAPGKFSLGMSQRLGIAAALLANPKHLILDEPANGLDPEGIAWLRKFISDYADQGNAVLVSSHLLSEMAQMADNIVVIGKGKMIANTTIDMLVGGSKSSGVFIRASKLEPLKKALTHLKLNFDEIDTGLLVHGSTVEAVGQLAFDAKVVVHELTARKASLEDAFLEMTQSSEEYQGHGGVHA